MINILYQFNDKYAPFAGVSITSLFENNKKYSICVYILGENLSNDTVILLEELAMKYNQTIVINDALDVIEQMKKWGIPPYRGSYSANLRLFLTWFVDEAVDKIIYLDADTIVAGDINSLLRTDLEQKTIGMVIDSLGNKYKDKLVKGISNISNNPYYNSGVILFDLNKWRREAYTEKIVEHIKAGNVNYTSPDQDILNVVINNDILTISPKFNFQPFHMVYDYKLYYKCFGTPDYYKAEEIIAAKKDVCIYHSLRYVGEFPWDKDTIHPYREIFDYYLKMSPWKDYFKKESEATLVMKIEKIMYKFLPRAIFFKIFSLIHHICIKLNSETRKSEE